MSTGWQEWLALAIVIAIVAFALYRRMRGRGRHGDCHVAADQEDERPVHFYRRDKR